MKIGKCLFPAYTRAEVTMMILIQTYAFLLTYVLKVYLARESKEKINWLSFSTFIFLGILIVFSNLYYLRSHDPLKTLIAAGLLTLLLALSYLDYRSEKVPLKGLVLLLPIVLYLGKELSFTQHLYSLLLCLVPLISVFLLFPQQLGLGDLFFSALVSFLLKPDYVLIFLLTSCLSASIYLLILNLKQNEKQLPFIPFLSIGLVIALGF